MIWSLSLQQLLAGMLRMQSSGALDGIFDIRVARPPRDLVNEYNSVLLLALPVNGHRSVMERLVPSVVDQLQMTPPVVIGVIVVGVGGGG